MHHPSPAGPATPAKRARAARITTALLAVVPMIGLAAQDPAPKPAASSASKQEPSPWRLDDALGTPDWLKISGEVRVRYEGIEGQFRSTDGRRLDNSDHLMVTRSIVKAEADFDTFGATLELLDARQFGAGDGSFLNTTVVNPIDFLQAFGEVETGEFAGGSSRLLAGRETLDLGSRRLVARNRFRNTINAFDAVDWMWTGEDTSVRAFWSMPVSREPADFQGLLDNELELDDSSTDRQFYGVFVDTEIEGTDLELYAFGLNQDGNNGRDFYTPGFRLVRNKKRNAIDYEWEAAAQFGEQQATRNNQPIELDHFAWFTHISVGYTFDHDWQPRVRLAYDFASGDSDPSDGDSGRFNTLFGARRFEYGPTGIYGAIARSNISSPEVRFEAKPTRKTDCLFAYRPLWLAEGNDNWTTASLRDPVGGAADNFVGHQIEARVRYNIVPKNIRLEVGAAHLFAGDFMENAPNSRGEDTTYFYTQVFFYF